VYRIRAELEDVFGDGDEYDDALVAEEKASKKQIVRMEDVSLCYRLVLVFDTNVCLSTTTDL